MTQRTVIIGGTSGIGLATAELLLGRDHEVVIAGRDPERLRMALKQLGTIAATDRFSGRTTDASDERQLAGFFAAVGPFDHLVVAATPRGGLTSLAELEGSLLTAYAEGKLLAHLLAVKAALPGLRADGSITLLGAVSSELRAPGLVVLASINAAVETAAHVLAAELAPRRVNAVSPGVIATEWWDWVPEGSRRDVVEGAAAGAALGRPGRPQEVAHAVAFLIENTYTTGVVLPVDGGARLRTGR